MNKLHTIAGRIIYVVMYPCIVLLMNGSTRVRSIVICNKRVLLVQHTLGKGFWEVPGGGVKKNEEASEAAIRELHEELCLDITPKTFKEFARKSIPIGSGHYTAIYLYAEIDLLPKISTNKKEVVAYGFFTRHELSAVHMRAEERQVVLDCLNRPKMIP